MTLRPLSCDTLNRVGRRNIEKVSDAGTRVEARECTVLKCVLVHLRGFFARAGYFRPLDSVWWNWKRLIFRLRGFVIGVDKHLHACVKISLGGGGGGVYMCVCVCFVFVCFVDHRPDMTFAVDWALKNNYLSVLVDLIPLHDSNVNIFDRA